MKDAGMFAKKKQLPALLKVLGVAAALGIASSAGAVTINQGLVGGTENLVEDQDREAYFDIDRSGTISVGDVFVGFVRIDDFNTSGLPAANHVYGIISNQVIGAVSGNPNLVALGVTTVAGLKLEDITGDANAAGGLVAIYDSAAPYVNNVITQSAPGAVGMKDDIDYIANGGILRLVAGFDTVENDTYLWANVDVGFGIGANNGNLYNLPAGSTFGSYRGGLDFIYNNTNFTFTDNVFTNDQLGGFHLTEVAIKNGSFGGSGNGAADPTKSVYTNGSQFGAFAQCSPPYQIAPGDTAPHACGFTTKADFAMNPVPEPGTLVLLGASLLGLTGIRRRSSKV